MALDLDTSDIIPGSDEEEEALTPGQIHKILLEAWQNEKIAPELLEAKPHIFDYVLECSKQLRAAANDAKNEDVRYVALLMQATRLDYLLTDLARTRLRKIETFAESLLRAEEARSDLQAPRMTADEFRFAKSYNQSFMSHYSKLFLSKVPVNMRKLESKTIAVQPNLNAFTFVRVNRAVNRLAVTRAPTDETRDRVDLREGELHLLQYAFVRELVEKGDVTLM